MTRLPVIAFDMDGVLVDSKSAIETSLELAFASAGIHSTEEARTTLVGQGIREIVSSRLGNGRTDDDIDKIVSQYRKVNNQIGPGLTSVYPGIPDSLQILCKHYSLVVVTSKLELSAKYLLDHLGLSKYFQGVYGQKSDLRQTRKSETISGLRRELESMETAMFEIVALVGDRDLDFEAAAETGIQSVGVRWGYGDSEELAKAQFVAESPSDLVRFFIN